jgi:hypothetical protein
MDERLRSKNSKTRHGFIGMVEHSKETKPDVTIPKSEAELIPLTDLRKETHLKQARSLLAVALDANRGFPQLRKNNPELYRKITDEQHEVAEKRRRAQNNPDILDMRLD